MCTEASYLHLAECWEATDWPILRPMLQVVRALQPRRCATNILYALQSIRPSSCMWLQSTCPAAACSFRLKDVAASPGRTLFLASPPPLAPHSAIRTISIATALGSSLAASSSGQLVQQQHSRQLSKWRIKATAEGTSDVEGMGTLNRRVCIIAFALRSHIILIPAPNSMTA